MPEIHQDLAETNIEGRRTRRWVLEAKDCAELVTCRIARLGLDEACAPYRRVRLRPGGSFFLDCMDGEGRILLEGRWQKIGAGVVCMAPPRIPNAFFAPPGRRWVFAWVRYDEPPWANPLVGAGSPVRATAGAGQIARIITGLRAEWDASRDARMIHHWVSLLHATTRRLAQPWSRNDRLSSLWGDVAVRLAERWTLPQLARRVHMSAEHLRRLCLRELGRSPMQHLTYMRIQRAQELLETTHDKLEAVAPEVGYESALAFSRAFTRCVGLTPSQYRSHR
jgi:AraC-like DNA-binding protein